MNMPPGNIELLLFFGRFLVGSSLILGGVRIIEKLGLLRNRDLAELTWKVAIVASFMLLLPVSTTYAPQINLDEQASEYLQTLLIGNEATDSGERTEQSSQSLFQAPGNEIRLDHQPGNAELISAFSQESPQELPQELRTDNTSGLTKFILIPVILAALALVSLLVTYVAAIRWLGPRQRVDSDHRSFRLLFDICDKANIKSTPYFTWTKRIQSPLCLPSGEICLPAWALETNLPDQELRGLIAHEVAHLRRRDPIVLLTLHALTRLFFLQPLFFMAQKRLAALAELAADEWAASQSDSPKVVAEALLACAKQITSKQQPQWGLAMARNKSELRVRVERLLDANISQFKATTIWTKGIAIVGLITTALAIPALGIDRIGTSDADVSITSSRSTNTSASMSISSDGSKHGTYRWEDAGTEVSVSWQGAYALTPDERSLSSVSRNGYFILSERDNEHYRSIKFTNQNGNVRHAYSIDGTSRKLNLQDKDWLSRTLVHYMRTSGANANDRVARILKQDGVTGILSEMEQLGEIALHYYVGSLLEKEDLKPGEVRRLVKILSRIDSDYGMRQVFGLLLAQTYLTNDSIQQILLAVEKIESDYEMRTLLTNLLERRELDDKLFPLFLRLSETIQSDYESRVLLITSMQQENLTTRDLSRLMDIARENINSDYELRVLVVYFAEHFGGRQEAMGSAINALNSIGSDYESRTALIGIVENSTLDHQGWLSVIDATLEINSDFEGLQALLAILESMPNDEDLISALTTVAEENIGSEFEQDKFFRALRKVNESGI